VRRLLANRTLRLATGVAVSVIFLAATFRQVDLAAVARILASAQPAWILVAIAFAVSEVTVRAVRWRMLLLPFRHVPLRYAAGYLCVGYFANTMLPARLGDLARAALAGRTLGIPRLATLGTIVVERIVDGLTIFVVVIGCGLVATGVSTLVTTAVLLAAALVAVAAILAGALLLAHRLNLHQTRHGATLVAFARRIAVGGTAMRNPATFCVVLGLTLVAFGLAVGAFLATATAVGVSVTPLQAAVVMGGMALSTAIPAAPGSLGTYEFVGVALLTSFGIAPEAALAMVLLVHAIALLIPSLAGLVTIWILHVNVREVAAGVAADSPTVAAT
jgi:glycosyltransferase 2 family protein